MKNGGRIPWSVTAICESFKISCLKNRDYINLVQKSCLVADIEELEEMDASELHARNLNAKVLTPMNGENFIFPIRAPLAKPRAWLVKGVLFEDADKDKSEQGAASCSQCTGTIRARIVGHRQELVSVERHTRR